MDRRRYTENWQSQGSIVNKYKSKREKFLQLPSELQNMSDRQLGGINTAEHLIELKLKDECPVHSSSLDTCQTMSNLATKKVQKMLEKKVIEPANTK